MLLQFGCWYSLNFRLWGWVGYVKVVVMVVFLLNWEGAFPSFSHYYTRSIGCEFTVITILVFCFDAKDTDADAQRDAVL